MAGRTRYLHDLSDLHQRLLYLAEMVDRALVQALWAVSQHNPATAQRVLQEERAIDEQRNGVEDRVLHLLACQQPLLGQDLRVVSATLLVALELERIGDEARAIAVHAMQASAASAVPTPLQLEPMAHTVRTMLQQAMRALLTQNADIVPPIQQMDVQVQQVGAAVIHEALHEVRTRPILLEWGLAMVGVAQSLDRIAQRSWAVAGRAVFVVTGTLPPLVRNQIPTMGETQRLSLPTRVIPQK